MTELQDKLIEELQNLTDLLDKYDVKNWSLTFSKIQKMIDNGDKRGIDSLKNVRGGMGSFTDLVICQINGHRIMKNEEDYANTELIRLGNLVFNTADKLNREINKNSA
ncbi:DUF6966 domain-containing protein [Mangrovimonas spongiae]|uniref:DUF6966 domain-containing protein n=1 Tax=Mangrovimonas spongiae TaxID=2494697 RepID=A0A428K4H4_9FLAO|nr:hypothetical protein [Mangrovimonas spongiae]RSK41336.1 hypothetical protein EJA19_00240 [Mangrovimonas spongiae]